MHIKNINNSFGIGIWKSNIFSLNCSLIMTQLCQNTKKKKKSKKKTHTTINKLISGGSGGKKKQRKLHRFTFCAAWIKKA